MNALDPDVKTDLLAHAMERVGFAIWQVQALEETVANYLVIRVRGEKGMGRAKGQELLDVALGMTFGGLVKALKGAGVLEASLAARLSAAVDERNWFAHRGRRETRGMFSRPALYESLIVRAARLAEEALVLNKIVGNELVAFVKASGVDEKKWAREADNLAKSWGLRD